MIGNYIKIAWRILWKNKLFSLINVISLAIGLSASFIIGLMVYHEFTFDKFHEDVDQIYRVTTEYTSPDDKNHSRGVASPLRETLKEGVPGIEITSAFFTADPATVKISETGQRHKNLKHVVYADENYFKLFNYNWISGNNNSLNEPNEVTDHLCQTTFCLVILLKILVEKTVLERFIGVERIPCFLNTPQCSSNITFCYIGS